VRLAPDHATKWENACKVRVILVYTLYGDIVSSLGLKIRSGFVADNPIFITNTRAVS